MKVSTTANWPIPPELQRDSAVTRPSVAQTLDLDLCLSGYGKYPEPSNKISSGSPDSSPVHLYYVLGGKRHCDSTVPCPAQLFGHAGLESRFSQYPIAVTASY